VGYTRQSRGFTLLEMIVATTIMGIAVAGLMSTLATSTRNAARLQDYDRAVQLGRVRMNELLLDRQIPRNIVVNGVFDQAQTGGLEAGWRAKLTQFAMPPQAAAGDTAIDRVELEVWWASGLGRRTFTLEALRPRLLKPEDFVAGAVK
jgi:general secretion pathway protein I